MRRGGGGVDRWMAQRVFIRTLFVWGKIGEDGSVIGKIRVGEFPRGNICQTKWAADVVWRDGLLSPKSSLLSPEQRGPAVSDPGAGGCGEEKQDGQSGDPGKSGEQASGG